MRKRVIAVALVAAILAPMVLIACGHPMQNKELDNPNRDDTGKMMKQAGTDSD